jgi:hypothetical protein
MAQAGHGGSRVAGGKFKRLRGLGHQFPKDLRGVQGGRLRLSPSQVHEDEGNAMDLLTVFLIWCVFAVPVGWVMAAIESKVNGAPPRTKNAILWSVLLGPIGWIVVAIRSNLHFASGIRRDIRAQGDAAREQLGRHDAS